MSFSVPLIAILWEFIHICSPKNLGLCSLEIRLQEFACSCLSELPALPSQGTRGISYKRYDVNTVERFSGPVLWPFFRDLVRPALWEVSCRGQRPCLGLLHSRGPSRGQHQRLEVLHSEMDPLRRDRSKDQYPLLAALASRLITVCLLLILQKHRGFFRTVI